MVADIIPAIKTRSDQAFFSYKVPESLANLKIGQIVTVPFGPKKIRGVVAGIRNKELGSRDSFKLKEILKVDGYFSLPPMYLDISKWIAEYYLCTQGEAIAMFLPPEMVRPAAQPQNKELRIKNKVKQPIRLNAEQEAIFQRLLLNIQKEDPKPALLFGVTGSGKTEIYLKLAAEILKQNKQIVVLVPEIMLTPQTVERFEEVFADKICLMHSGLSKSEKLNCYQQFYSGQKPIIVGPRSALLVPSDKIGLIIVDEEQEDAYKQDQNPRYHAVDLAEKISKESGVLLLLGSATPRVESFFKTKNGQYDLYELKKRHQKEELPAAKIIDLRQEILNHNNSPISGELEKAIGEVLAQKKQILLFLNRRGAASFVSCRQCGHVILCHSCSIPMVYHLRDTRLICHHCNANMPVPALCPECQSPKIKYFGAGVEKIETEIRRLFPEARIKRVDSETITKKGDYLKFFKELSSGSIDIAIGTQMIAKGFDFPGVDLVGVVSADTGLHLPQYRATEKTFQIITQVSGRSGRREHQGLTLIQSYWPESEAILAASQHDYRRFYDKEILEREKFGYPPFSHIVRIISENADKNKAFERIKKIVPELEKLQLDFVGPGACFFSRLHNKFRYHIIFKLKNLPDDNMSKIKELFPDFVYEAEPTSML